MVKIAKGNEIQTGRVGGTGGNFEGDVSAELSDMRNYEKTLLETTYKGADGKQHLVFELLADLEIFVKGVTKPKEYGYMVIEPEDFVDMEADSTGSAGHALNSEFAAMRIPFRATPFSSKDATKKSSINDDGDEGAKQTDSIKIERVSEEFDEKLYAVPECDDGFGLKVSKKGKNAGNVLVHEKYTVGQKLRAEKWITEVAVEEIDAEILSKIGIEVE